MGTGPERIRRVLKSYTKTRASLYSEENVYVGNVASYSAEM